MVSSDIISLCDFVELDAVDFNIILGIKCLHDIIIRNAPKSRYFPKIVLF